MNVEAHRVHQSGNRGITTGFSATKGNGERVGNTSFGIRNDGQKTGIFRTGEEMALRFVERGGRNVKLRRPISHCRFGARNTPRGL